MLPPPHESAVLLDMDGVLYHGRRVLPGAVDFIHAIGHQPHAFITNNPRIHPAEIKKKLSGMGFPLAADAHIITSAQATAQWLHREKPGFRYFAVGEQGLHDVLKRHGTEDSEHADYVVIGEGKGLDFDTLTTGINLILQRHARLIATNPDVNVDDDRGGEHCVVPGCGALTAPFEIATGASAIVIGKPEPLLYRMALAQLGVGAAESIMIGDRPDTDIAGAARIGMRTALVRSGCFAPGSPYPPDLPTPDWDVDSLTELMEKWGIPA